MSFLCNFFSGVQFYTQTFILCFRNDRVMRSNKITIEEIDSRCLLDSIAEASKTPPYSVWYLREFNVEISNYGYKVPVVQCSSDPEFSKRRSERMMVTQSGEELTFINFFALVNNPNVVCLEASGPRGTMSFSFSKQLRRCARLQKQTTQTDQLTVQQP